MRFRVLENWVFSNQLRTEMGRAKEDCGRAAEDLDKVDVRVRRTIDEISWPLVNNYVLRQARDNALAMRRCLSKKIEK